MVSNGMYIRRRGGHFVFAALIVGHALLISSQVTTAAGHSALQGAILAVFAPLQRGGEALVSGVRSVWYGYVDLRAVREENRQLREKATRLEQALWMEREVVARYDRLSSILQLAERIPFDSIVAEVIGVDASSWFRTITVNRGLDRGVELNAPVVGPGGLVGRITAVGPHVAQVQLLADHECSVGALLVRTRTRGIVSGQGGAQLELKYVSNLEDVAVGDVVVTSGIDGIYPKGIAIGRVASVRNGPRLFKSITVEPAASLNRLEEVFVLEPIASNSELTEKVE
ncbi:MAG TPA: rod shape-determining protein MreC [Vicinamibacteria bacterium]